MYRERTGTDSAERVYVESEQPKRISEAERLRAKGEARRHQKHQESHAASVRRNREEEQKRSQQLKERSGSRYADKQEEALLQMPAKSRYADKQETPYAKPVPKKTDRHSTAELRAEKAAPAVSASRYAQPEETGDAPAAGNLWERWINGLKRRDSLAVAVLAVLVVFAAGYLIVGMFYSSHFYSGTTILGIPCGKMTVEQAKEAISERIGEYRLTVNGRSATDTVTAAQAGVTYRDEGGVEALMKSQHSLLWPVMMLLRRDTVLEVGTKYDHSRVDGILDQMECFKEENIIRPQDAYLGTDESGFVVVPEVMGSLPDREAVKNLLMQALDQEKTQISLEQADCYVKPEIYSDNEELIAQAQERNALLGAEITLDFGERQEVVNAPVLIGFMEEASDGSHYISADRIYEYVEKLANKYDTYGGYRPFYTSLQTVVDLYGGDYGWLMDQAATADELAEAIRQKKTMKMEPIYTHTAKDRGLNDIGDTYVEICISLQEMWCYQDGTLIVDTPVVTGNPNRNNGTPSGGVWEIDAKMQDYTLVGRDYRTPVSYWMPFNGNVGIHDLKARYYFGGDIYLYNGSHGCVNTPMEAVKQIYSAVSVGTPVIVYD